MVAGHPSSNAHVGLEVVDGSFHDGSDFIKGTPFLGIPLDAGEHAEVHVLVSVSGAPFFGSAAGFLAVTDPLPIYHVDFRTDPFVPVGTAFFVAVPCVFHVKGGVFGAGGVTVTVITDFFERAFIPWVIGDQCF